MTKAIDLNKSTTFCMGLWHINNNSKYPFTHYLEHIPRTMAMLRNANIVFFYEDDKILKYVRKHAATPNLIPKKVPLVDLPTHIYADVYFQSCRMQDNAKLEQIEESCVEKGLVHYYRDFDAYKELFTIWTSKLFLLDSVMQENPFNTEYFSWVDASLARFNHKRPNWDFRKQDFSSEYVYLYGNVMRYMGEYCEYNASFIFGVKEKLSILVSLFKEQLECSRGSNYAHDEETLLHLIPREKRGLLCKIDRPVIYMHFHKSAGTSIISSLINAGYKAYPAHMNGNSRVENSHLIDFWNYNEEQLLEFADELYRHQVSLVSLEWNFLRHFSQVLKNRFQFLTIIRDPYDRFLSTYRVRRKCENLGSIAEFSSRIYTNMDIEEKMQRVNNQEFPIIINEYNYYTKMLNGFGNIHNVELNEAHLIKAKQILSAFDVLILENLEKTKLRKYGLINLSHSNRSIGEVPHVPEDFKVHFQEQNAFDYELYRYCTEMRIQ